MGRPKHFCEKPQDPYLQYVVTTTTTPTTLAPFVSYIKYPSYSGCVDLSNIVDNILPYYSGGSLLEFEGGGSCQFVRLDTVDTPMSQGAIVGFGDCGESVRSNVLLTSSSWQCLTSPGNVKILSGDIELTASNQSCECGDPPPTTLPPEVTTTTTTTIPPVTGNGCRIISGRPSTGYRIVQPDRLIVAYRIIPVSLDKAPNITFGLRKNDSLLEGYQFNKELTNNSIYVESTFQETRARKANLIGWNIVTLQGCPEDYDYCVQSDYTRISSPHGNLNYNDDGPIWELVELYYNSNYNLQDLWTMNRWVGSNSVEKWLKKDKDIISGSMPEPINNYYEEETEEYKLTYSDNLGGMGSVNLLEPPDQSTEAYKFLLDIEEQQVFIWNQQRRIEDKVNNLIYSENRATEIVIGLYDSQYWNITNAFNSPSLNNGSLSEYGNPEAIQILIGSDDDGSRTEDYFYTFESGQNFDDVGSYPLPAMCRFTPWKDIDFVPQRHFPGLITYE